MVRRIEIDEVVAYAVSISDVVHFIREIDVHAVCHVMPVVLLSKHVLDSSLCRMSGFGG